MPRARIIRGAHGKAKERADTTGHKLKLYELGQEEELTPAEKRVLIEISYGYSQKEVAYRFGVSWSAVRHHTKHIRMKMGKHTTAGCVAEAFRRGWLS